MPIWEHIPLFAASMIIALASALLLLLTIPFQLSIHLRKDGPAVEGAYSVATLGITLRRSEIGLKGSRDSERDKRSKDTMEEQGKKSERPRRFRRSPSPLALLGASTAALAILLDLGRSIDLEEISCRLRFGFDDPALTAVTSGYLWSAIYASGPLGSGVLIEPCFEGERLQVCLMARLQARIMWMVLAVLRGLCKKEIRGLILEVVRGK
jgi:hypothetical protein